MLGQQRLISSSFLGEVFISCPDNADVSFKLAEIFDSLETGNSSSTKLTAHLLDLLTKIVEYLQDVCGFSKILFLVLSEDSQSSSNKQLEIFLAKAIVPNFV